jgi:DNA polymerase III psi subunit
MISSRQQAYLDAMGIGVWSLREAALPSMPAIDNAPGLRLGSGSGGVLLLCAADTDSASRLANDISRALGGVPVWAWPIDDTGAVRLADAVDENLFTTIAIFGRELAGQFFEGELPDSLNSASLVLLPEMQDLQNHAEARRALWATFCRSGMVSKS